MQTFALALYVAFLVFFALLGVCALFAAMPWLAIASFGVVGLFPQLFSDDAFADDDTDL
jgi:hypothetical protein